MAAALRARAQGLTVECVRDYAGGVLRGAGDEVVLSAATSAGLVLVTRDRRTIEPMVRQWSLKGRAHGGVLFVASAVRRHDLGPLVLALQAHWLANRDSDLTNVTAWLRPGA
jgi:hypothetical protein